jgi:hypothetical protein
VIREEDSLCTRGSRCTGPRKKKEGHVFFVSLPLNLDILVTCLHQQDWDKITAFALCLGLTDLVISSITHLSPGSTTTILPAVLLLRPDEEKARQSRSPCERTFQFQQKSQLNTATQE